MRKWTGFTLGIVAVVLFSTVVYAQSRFELNAWSLSNTPAVAGSFATEHYSLMSGMPLVLTTATPMPITPEPVTPTPVTPEPVTPAPVTPTGQDLHSVYIPLLTQ